jgi:hypothetical protein
MNWEIFQDPKNWTPATISAIAVMMSLRLLASVGKFMFNLLRKKEDEDDKKLGELSSGVEKLDRAVADLNKEIGGLRQELIEVRKYKADTQKLFTAVKIIAGPQWARIRRAIKDEELPP